MAKPKSDLWLDVFQVKRERGQMWKDNGTSYLEESKVLEILGYEQKLIQCRSVFLLTSRR